MNTVISFTMQQMFNLLLALCGAIITVSGAVMVIIKAIQTVNRPDKIQDERIQSLEDEVKSIQERLILGNRHFEADAAHIKAIEEANAVTQKAILALLSHAINGNDVESLKRAKLDLEDYLLENKSK